MAKRSTSKSTNDSLPKDRLLPRLTMFFFKRSGTAALIWLVIALFGIASYTTLLKRSGFPSVNVPLVVVSGNYAVNDPVQVDKDLSKTISQIALKQPDVSTVITSNDGSFFNAIIQYQENVKGSVAKKQLQKAVEADSRVPANAHLNYTAPYFGVTGDVMGSDKVDVVISVYDKSGKLDLNQLKAKASAAAKQLNAKKLAQADKFSVGDPFQTIQNPATGQSTTVQRKFDRFGVRENGQSNFYQSVVINVSGVEDFDVLKLDDEITAALKDINNQPGYSDVKLAISASNGPTIDESISELQRVLLEGLLAVLVIGSIIIAVRASLIIVLAMISVLLGTVGALYLLNYSLNVITLFGLILSLSLIVDDTIIMTEAIDAARRRNKRAADAVQQATRKISRAMLAATLTAALSFTPLLFVGGILGSFIRAIPVSIISALLISLFVALVIIPLFAKFLLLGKKQMGEGSVVEVAAGIEGKIADLIARPMGWAKHSRGKEIFVGLSAVILSVIVIMLGGAIFNKYVEFNIFPPTKDTNMIAYSLTYQPGTSIDNARRIAARADQAAKKVVGPAFVEGSYYGLATNQTATAYIELTPYGQRDVTAPQLVSKLDKEFKSFKDAKVDAYTVDVGPPISGFTVNIDAHDRDQAIRLANDMTKYLKGRELKRTNGTSAKIIDASVANTDNFERKDNQPIVKVNATFDGSDVSALTIIAEKTIKDKYTDTELAPYGLKANDVKVDLGQESENQDSFKTLAIAFPAVLAVIYILLAIQFRSLLQPLIIFMAIPFSFFGIAVGLAATDNPFSFFTMLGFFALIGLSIKNTILLTDYANQSRRAGMAPVDAAIEALHERFRPLIATSLTAVVSLIPLAVTSPFWQALAMTLIGGLLSSTFLVVTVFPYYYLGAEFLRSRINRRTGLSWIVLSIIVMAIVAHSVPAAAPLGLIIAAMLVYGVKGMWKARG